MTLAVFELSAYQHSDIATWAHYFYGPAFTPPLVDVNVDGGPLHPICPKGDTCPAEFNGYSGDIEVDADIEMQLALSPAARHIVVYNAPNDFTGQTELDEYTKIADDDVADVISSSWGVCENDVSAAYVQAENRIFQQMALQGQSVFGSAGDAGAFDADVDRLIDWVKASPPISPGGVVLLPGEIEAASRRERIIKGLPIDEATWRGVVATAASLGVAIPKE